MKRNNFRAHNKRRRQKTYTQTGQEKTMSKDSVLSTDNVRSPDQIRLESLRKRCNFLFGEGLLREDLLVEFNRLPFDDSLLVHIAIGLDHVNALKVLKENGFSLYKLDDIDGSLLHFAAEAGSPKVCTYLIEAGLSSSDPDGIDQTPIMVAAKFGKWAAAEAILRAGTRKDELFDRAWDAMQVAAATGQFEFIDNLRDYLMEFPETADFPLLAYKGPEFEYLKWSEQMENWGSDDAGDAKTMFEDIGGATAKFEFGTTILHMATLTDNPKTTGLFIHLGANLDARDILGNTPLHYSALNGNYGAAKALLDAGAHPNSQNDRGETPIGVNTNLELTPLFMSFGALRFPGGLTGTSANRKEVNG